MKNVQKLLVAWDIRGREGWPKFFSIYNVAILFIYIYLVNEKYYFLY